MQRLSPSAVGAGSLVVALGVVLAGCGGGSTTATGSSGASSTSTSASTTTSTPSATPSVTAHHAPDLSTANLAALLAPAPPGFTPSHRDGDLNGAFTAAEFDNLTDTGEAAKLGFRTGQSVTYGTSTVEVEYDLLRLTSPAGAAAFIAGFGEADPSDPTKPFTGTDRAIPGSVTVNPTVDDGNDAIEYDLFVQVGSGIMVTSYYPATIAASDTDALQRYAAVQYALIT